MSPGPSKRRQSSLVDRDSGYWFDLPDVARQKTRRQRLRLLAGGLAAAAALLLTLTLFRGVF